MLSACALSSSPSQVEQAATGQADVSLSSSNATISQTSNTAWTLTKTGSVDTSSSTVKWTITATKTSTVAGQLIVSGVLVVSNSGSLGATIGNIVANLQTKSGSTWVTRASDIADATHGDAATTAAIDPHGSSEHKSAFSTSSASGKVEFEDASSNTLFSLSPEVTVPPGGSITLLFSASYDNTLLRLATGSAVRSEVIVSFGNGGPQPPSAANVDINGNGVIDADEAWVRSVPARNGLTVPAQTADNSTVSVTDGVGDITTTGTVTFSNAQFNLGATSGTVTVSYSGGASGGKITNCAHLTGSGTTQVVNGFQFPVVGGVNLTACDTETIGASTCTPGAPGCGWQNGDLTTYSQSGWGAGGAAASLLSTDFGSVYASTSGVFEIGTTSDFVVDFTSASTLEQFLPQSGAVGVLNSNLQDPTSTAAGAFAGNVAALKLNVDFSDGGDLTSNAHLKFGDLLICGVATPSGINGMTVRSFLSTANTKLGGGTSSFSATDLNSIAQQLDGAFGGGSVSTFAQSNLVNASSCP